jgi:magnesium-transporting ATPase (P-type)
LLYDVLDRIVFNADQCEWGDGGCSGEVSDVRWEDVCVGDIVKVVDGELIPADLLCLHVELPDGVCFIKTTNLDGESNLKIRRPVQMESGQRLTEPTDLLKMKGVLECEKPNADLHSFRVSAASTDTIVLHLPTCYSERSQVHELKLRLVEFVRLGIKALHA